jgi:hypothetical protein
VAKNPEVELTHNQPVTAFDTNAPPQGKFEDAVAGNANLEPTNIAGMVAAAEQGHRIMPSILQEQDNKIVVLDADPNDDGIIAVVDIPATNNHNPIFFNADANKEEEHTDNYSSSSESDDENLANSDTDHQNSNQCYPHRGMVDPA